MVIDDVFLAPCDDVHIATGFDHLEASRNNIRYCKSSQLEMSLFHKRTCTDACVHEKRKYSNFVPARLVSRHGWGEVTHA
jgi:hypothetical protein